MRVITFQLHLILKICPGQWFLVKIGNKSTGIDDNLKVSLFAADYSEYLKRQN